MKEFFEELKWACTDSNAVWFYRFVAIALLLLTIGCVASLVLIVVNLVVYHVFKIMWLLLFIFTLAAVIGIIIWLKKS